MTPCQTTACKIRSCQQCGRSSTTIHARGLCSNCYKHHRDEYAKTKVQRPFSSAEREVIRRDWGRRKAAAIAASMGRQVRDVYAAAVRYGATIPRKMLRTSPRLRDRLVKLHARGLSDREIGRIVGHSHGTVARWLRRLGLPSNCRTRPTDPFPGAFRAKMRQSMLDRIRDEGLESAVAFLRKHAEGRAKAARMGWPEAGTLLEARILDALAAAPTGLTVRELAATLSARINWLGVTTRGLKRRGLVAVRGRDGRWCKYGLALGVGPQIESASRGPNEQAQP